MSAKVKPKMINVTHDFMDMLIQARCVRLVYVQVGVMVFANKNKNSVNFGALYCLKGERPGR